MELDWLNGIWIKKRDHRVGLLKFVHHCQSKELIDKCFTNANEKRVESGSSFS